MSVNTYDKQDSVRLKVTFKVDSVNIDPTTVTLRVKDSEGVTSVYTYSGASVTKESTGVYYKDITVTTDGVWYYRFEGTGACQAASEHKFVVRKSEF